MKRNVLTLLSAIALVALPATVQAIVVSIDEFGIDKNGASFFADAFDNGSTPSQEARYLVVGSFPNGAESGGLLTLDSAWGGGPRPDTPTLLALYKSPLNASGLTVNDSIEVFGLFDLVIPVGPRLAGYGVQVRNGTNDFAVELGAGYSPTLGGSVISFFSHDIQNRTFGDLGSVALSPPSWADQIALVIVKPDSGSPDFFGAYAYCSGGACRDEDFTIFSAPFALFGSTDFVLSSFWASSTVPEPGTLALLGLGLGGLVATRRRRR